jgi:uncharacterized membrane protein YbhN (UPF0104 family)
VSDDVRRESASRLELNKLEPALGSSTETEREAPPPPGAKPGKLAKPAKRLLGTLVRAAAGIAILVLVLTRVPLADLKARLAHFRAVDAALLVVLAVLQMSTGAMRWWRLLSRLGDRVKIAAVWRDLLVGALFNTFLPTSFGGDVIRGIRMSKRLEVGHRAWSTSVFERLVGLLTLAVIGALGVLFAVGDALPPRPRIIVVVVAALLALSFFFVSAPLRVLVRVLEKRLPASFIDDVRGVIADLEGPLASVGVRVETFAWSFAGFALNIVYVAIGARALGAPEHLLAVIVGLPIVGVLSLAPISLGGHGLREGLFVLVLGFLGVPRDVALGLALLALGYNVMFALAGGVVMLVEPTPKRR